MSIASLQRHGFLTPTHIRAHEQYGPLFDAQIAELSNVVDAANSLAAGVHQDRGLNKVGVTDRLHQAAGQFGQTLDKLHAARRRVLEQDLRAMNEEMPDVLPPPPAGQVPPIVHEQRLAEIRNALASMDAFTRTNMIRDAADAGDRDTVRAVQSAPFIHRGLAHDQTVIPDAVNRFWKATKPDAYAKRDAAQHALSIYDSNSSHARHVVGNVFKTSLLASGANFLDARKAAELTTA